MVISAKIEEAINKQINKEFFSWYLYLSASTYLDKINYAGMAKWMRLQASEEKEHAYKLYGYVMERGGNVVLDTIEKPKATWKSPLDVFQFAYDHELGVTKSIHNLVDNAKTENDHATLEFLNWFVKEQVEEEDHALKIVERLKLAGDNVGGLMIIDGELGRRGQ
jgi:ferritin